MASLPHSWKNYANLRLIKTNWRINRGKIRTFVFSLSTGLRGNSRRKKIEGSRRGGQNIRRCFTHRHAAQQSAETLYKSSSCRFFFLFVGSPPYFSRIAFLCTSRVEDKKFGNLSSIRICALFRKQCGRMAPLTRFFTAVLPAPQAKLADAKVSKHKNRSTKAAAESWETFGRVFLALFTMCVRIRSPSDLVEGVGRVTTVSMWIAKLLANTPTDITFLNKRTHAK